MATHLRFGGRKVELRSGGSLRNPCDMLAGLTRANLRAMREDPRLRDEALRRALSAPSIQCNVKTGPDGVLSHNCAGAVGMRYSSDEEGQALEGCAPNDTWSDWYGLLAGQQRAIALGNLQPGDPLVCDCDDMAPAALSVAAWIAWYAPPGSIAPEGSLFAGRDLHQERDDEARFATAITRPPKPRQLTQVELAMGKKQQPWIAHAFGLTNRRPPHPQPEIKIGETWWVWDPAAHWGMDRPPNDFYTGGPQPNETILVGYEIRREDLDGLAGAEFYQG